MLDKACLGPYVLCFGVKLWICFFYFIQAVLFAWKVQLGLWNALLVCALFPHTLAPAGVCFSQLQLLLACQIGLFSAQPSFMPAARTESDAVDMREGGWSKDVFVNISYCVFRGTAALLFQSTFKSYFSSSDTVFQKNFDWQAAEGLVPSNV